MPISGKRPCYERIRGYNTGEMEVEVGILLLGNDNNVIPNNVFSLVFKLQV